jgi:hypothetical protein
MKDLTLWFAVFSGVLSAVFWIISSMVSARPNPNPDASGWISASIQDESGNDVVQTLAKQSVWNRRAAFFAALAALSQTINTYLQFSSPGC